MLFVLFVLLIPLDGVAETGSNDTLPAINRANDSIVAVADSLYERLISDSIVGAVDSMMTTDTLLQQTPSSLLIDSTKVRHKREPRDWSKWKPDPQRALWLALIVPGGGQIYNRKYWKLPLVYGGFIGCIYAMSWNSMMYKDYQQAYLDIMDDDPNTASYNKFLHLGRQIDDSNIERYKQIFKSRKDKYRRWRDMSFFVMIGVYALSVIDAYVDAELSEFDISKDLTMKVRPSVMSNGLSQNPVHSTSVGLNCSLNF